MIAMTRPSGSVVISGTGLGLPGAEKQVMDPDNALRILRGEQFVDLIPERFRKLDGQQAHHPAGESGGRQWQFRHHHRSRRSDQIGRAPGTVSTWPKSMACRKS